MARFDGVVNGPERVFSGTNRNGREVDIYYRKGSVVITEAGDKTSVITAYGAISRNNPSPVDPNAKWATNVAYVEIQVIGENKVIFPNRERWERQDWP